MLMDEDRWMRIDECMRMRIDEWMRIDECMRVHE